MTTPSREQLELAVRASDKKRRRAERERDLLLHGSTQPIAIVGMSCRYPGAVTSPEDLWQLVVTGTEGLGPFPTDRGWDLDRLYHPDPDHPHTTYVQVGGFLDRAGEFDEELFSLSPREALAMDPQQRLMLEGAWEAFEDAGIPPLSMRGAQAGVYLGVAPSQYGPTIKHPPDLEGIRLTGTIASVVSGRVSYVLGLQGPAVSIDTACSSSLVAIHLACRALRAEECNLALAGGVTVMATPNVFVGFSRLRGLAEDGRCKAFGAEADGTNWAEGIGVLLLERLSDAQENGHRVLAVIPGSAIGQDGASNGLTAPNGPSQERVIANALADAGLAAADIDAVEAHGTGTPLGDPIEARALLKTYGLNRAGAPLWVGSLKSNIGHAQCASGVAGMIKIVQALRHEILPQTLHAELPSEHVDWSAGDVRLLTEPRDWPRRERPRIAAVSSFGISGTNAHILVQEAPRTEADTAALRPSTGSSPAAYPFILSGTTKIGLQAQADRLHAHLGMHPQLPLADIATTLALHRSHLPQRAIVLAQTPDELTRGLQDLAAGNSRDAIVTTVRNPGPTAFLFSGQGSQRPGMGHELYQLFPVFASALDEVCQHADGRLGRSLKDVMFAAGDSAEAKLLAGTELTQPALFALEVALYRLLESLGISPDYLIGHSVGELTAAHVAGVMSLDDAAALVCARGQLMGALPTDGAMLAVQASEDEVTESLDGHGGRACIAAINAPGALVISGTRDTIESLEEHWRAQGRRTSRLGVSHAFHSHLMEPMLADLQAVAANLTLNEPQIPVISNVTGETATSEQLTSAAYWARHVREPVRYADGIRILEREDVAHFVEVGPDSTLSALAAQTIGEPGSDTRQFLAAMRGSKPEAESLLTLLASLYSSGRHVDWAPVLGHHGRFTDLPTHAFQRSRYWLASGDGSGDALGLIDGDHPIIDAAIPTVDTEQDQILIGHISLADHPWLADHAVMGTTLAPGTLLLELALVAAAHVDADTVDELTLHAPLIVDSGHRTQIQVRVTPADPAGRHEVSVHSRPADGGDPRPEDWVLHASGVLSAAAQADADPVPAWPGGEEWPPSGAEMIDSDLLYARLAAAGYEYGPAFRGLRVGWQAGASTFAEVTVGEQQNTTTGTFLLHPAVADSALHGLALEPEAAGTSGDPIVPFSFSGVRVHRACSGTVRVRLTKSDNDGVAVSAVDDHGALVFSIAELRTRPVDRASLRAATRRRQDLYQLGWESLPGMPPDEEAPHVAWLGESPESFPSTAGWSRHHDLEELIAATGESAPEVVVAYAHSLTETDAQSDLAAEARELTVRALELIQTFLASDHLQRSRLVLMTNRAVAISDTEEPNLVQGALTGLLRSAHSEHPGRVALVDIDGDEATWAHLPGLIGGHEPETAVRGGIAYVPRLQRTNSSDAISEGHWESEDDETILVTGGTGGLGAVVAAHLAHNGARHVTLLSRSGLEAPGADQLQTALEASGCQVTIAACDVTNRTQLQSILEADETPRRIRTVIHAAGVLDDGVLTSLDRQRLDRVLAVKVDGAVNLHEICADADLILFSSAAATLGAPAQANYAAANTFLDALAQHRHANGLPGQSLAWGPWETSGGMAGDLTEQDRARFHRLGISPLTDSQGLHLLDYAAAVPQPVLMPARLDLAALASQAKAGLLPAVLHKLVRGKHDRSDHDTDLLTPLLAAAPEQDWPAIILALVTSQLAAVLGHENPNTVDPSRGFKELGLDSLGAVELRNRLTRATTIGLPATLTFDHPTPTAVAEHLRSRVSPADATHAVIDAHLDGLESLIELISQGRPEHTRGNVRLHALAARMQTALATSGHQDRATDSDPAATDLADASDEDVLAFLTARRGDLASAADER